MTKNFGLFHGVLIVTILSVSLAAQNKKVPAPKATGPHVIKAIKHQGPKLPAAKPKSSCHPNGELPDSKCTPGVADAAVSQSNIKQTICVKDYAEHVRMTFAPQDYTDNLKKQQIAAYGYTDTNPADYEEDHLISLELGGHPNDPRNLWPESPHSPNSKDAVEDELHRKVCAGEMTLVDAQHIISTDWTKAK